jgi:hypothetical protein
MESEDYRLRTTSGHGRIIQQGDGSSTSLSQVSCILGMGHRGGELAKPTRSPRAFLICMISDRHCAIAVIVHESRYTFRRLRTTGGSWKIDLRLTII